MIYQMTVVLSLDMHKDDVAAGRPSAQLLALYIFLQIENQTGFGKGLRRRMLREYTQSTDNEH
jgi:hypothetical protein